MRLSIDPAVLQEFPGAVVAGVVVTDLTNICPIERAPRRTVDMPMPHTLDRLLAWQDAYRQLGLNPKRNRPSAEALIRQVERKGSLPNVNLIVDAYNDVSVRHAVPIGGYDGQLIVGDIVMTRARGGEPFVPLPIGSPPESVDEGEIVYRDRARVLTRRWNYRDSAEVSIGPSTTSVILCAEMPDASVDGDVVGEVADDLATSLTAIGGRLVATFQLSATAPTTLLGGL